MVIGGTPLWGSTKAELKRRDLVVDFGSVPRVAPHRRVVRVIDQVVLHRHDDRAGSILLTHDPRDRVGFKVDFAVPLGEAAFPRVRARMKAPRGDP